MSYKGISTDDAGRKVQALEWENKQHRELETQIADVLLFLNSVMGTASPSASDDIALDVNARNGLGFILAQTSSLLYHGACGTFYKLDAEHAYGSEAEKPHATEAA